MSSYLKEIKLSHQGTLSMLFSYKLRYIIRVVNITLVYYFSQNKVIFNQVIL